VPYNFAAKAFTNIPIEGALRFPYRDVSAFAFKLSIYNIH